MGGGCSKSDNQLVTTPTTNQQNAIQHELTPYLQIEHPHNINHKYTLFFTINRHETTGSGLRVTCKYTSKISMEEVLNKRDEYWDTRTEGRREAWQALKGAVEADDATCLAILQAAELKLVTNSLQLAYDLQGNKYDVPIFCLNNPSSFNLPKEKIFNVNDIRVTKLTIKLRGSGEQKDIEFVVENSMKIRDIKTMYLDAKPALKEKNYPITKIRLFFSGKELKDDKLIAEYDLQHEHVIQIFLAK
jgi:hypothetical protein